MSTQSVRTGSLIGGALLVALGLLFMFSQFVPSGAWQFVWPFVVVAVGGVFFVGMFAGGRAAAPLAIPGAIVAAVGLMLFVQNLTGYWTSWAYSWTVILIAVGLGIFIMGTWAGREEQRRSGLRVAGLGVVLFIVVGAFFELGGMLFGNRGPWQFMFPVLLIGLGLYQLAVRSGLLGGSPAVSAPVNKKEGQ